MTLGEKIQTLRKQKGMSQEKLADTLNISRQAVSKWETNESQPDIERLIEISNIFNVSIDYLVKGSYTPTAAAIVIRKDEDETIIRTSRISFWVSIIYTSATVIFLLLGFVWNLWHPGWIIFFVPPVASRLLAQFMAKNAEEYQAFEDAIEREDD